MAYAEFLAVAFGENVKGLSAVNAAEKGIAAMRKLCADIGLHAGLQALDVKEDGLSVMAENAQKDACMLTNPRKAKLVEMINI
jgi:alcohol dehydrogenase